MLQKIRTANLESKEKLTIELTTGEGKCTNLKLGSGKLSFIKLTTFGNMPNTDLKQLPIGNTVADHFVSSLQGDFFDILPAMYTRTSYIDNDVKYIKYSFEELEVNTSRIEIVIKSTDSLSFESYINPEDEVFLKNITWVSQFNINLFSLCTGCWQYTCCRRAAEYMMGNIIVADCTNDKISKKAPNMPIIGTIITAKFTDNQIKYTKDTYNSANLIFNRDNIKKAIDYVKDRLNFGKPVLIGVHYINKKSSPPNNSNRATRHFMIIVGIGKINDTYYFRFYDPGRSDDNANSATSVNNKLIINKETGSIQANYNNRTYTLSEIILTN
jgi:hypothetical protein